MPDIHDMEWDARPTKKELCPHKEESMVYQPYEPDNNLAEDYYCDDCGKQFDIPEPDEDTLRGDR